MAFGEWMVFIALLMYLNGRDHSMMLILAISVRYLHTEVNYKAQLRHNDMRVQKHFLPGNFVILNEKKEESLAFLRTVINKDSILSGKTNIGGRLNARWCQVFYVVCFYLVGLCATCWHEICYSH